MEVASQLAVESGRSGPRPLSCRSRISNKPHKMAIDGRTQLGRRLHDLGRELRRSARRLVGAVETMAAKLVRKAAELSALAEQTRADALANGNVEPLALVRLDGAATRAVRALGLDHRAGWPMGPTLGEYLAGLNADAPTGSSFEEPDAEEEASVETATSTAPNVAKTASEDE